MNLSINVIFQRSRMEEYHFLKKNSKNLFQENTENKLPQKTYSWWEFL